jgi:hypothetical protein
MTEAMAKLVLKRGRLEKRIAALSRERDEVLTEMAAEEGFKPCLDCTSGWCSMNCSSAPGYIKILA